MWRKIEKVIKKKYIKMIIKYNSGSINNPGIFQNIK